MLNLGDSVQIAGCSTKKRLLESSSGCNSFDTLLGGALVNSSIVLIDEYRSRSYGSYLIRSFLAQGVHHGHRCVVVDPVEDSNKTILKNIPVRRSDDTQKEDIPSAPMSSVEGGNNMKIAWRYANAKQVSSSVAPLGDAVQYDFTKNVENPSIEVFKEEIYSLSSIYKRLSEIVRENESHTKTTGRGGPKKNLLRVVLKNIDLEIFEDHESLGRFLCCLRSLARNSYMIVYMTANSYRVSKSLWRVLESTVDTHIQLMPFNEREKKLFKHLGTAHGYFHLKSLPRLMSVGTHTPPILDLIFEASSRKGFQVRVMHLPPAFDEPAPGQQNNLSCQSIDF